MYLRHIYLS